MEKANSRFKPTVGRLRSRGNASSSNLVLHPGEDIVVGIVEMNGHGHLASFDMEEHPFLLHIDMDDGSQLPEVVERLAKHLESRLLAAPGQMEGYRQCSPGKGPRGLGPV